MTQPDRETHGTQPPFSQVNSELPSLPTGPVGPPGPPAGPSRPPGAGPERPPAVRCPGSTADVSVRGPAELADALPYLIGFYPDDSIVAVALHGERGRFGGRLRVGIPETEKERQLIAPQIAECLEVSSLAHGSRPDGALVFFCKEPAAGAGGKDVMEELRPMAQEIRRACGELNMPVYELLCLSDGRYYSYCCPDSHCCGPDGMPLAEPGTSAMAAAAAYAGIRVHGSLREMEKRLIALGPPFADEQARALDAAGSALTHRLLTPDGRCRVREETLALAERLMERFHRHAPVTTAETACDAHDDGLLSHDEAAVMILGLQDRNTRDRAAAWMEGLDVRPALRLWRALCRRCVGPYADHAAAVLTLAGWVAWSGGDAPAARIALGRALRTDPDYRFAQLLHQACNEGLDPELLRQCLRRGRGAPRDAEPGEGPSSSGAAGEGLP